MEKMWAVLDTIILLHYYGLTIVYNLLLLLLLCKKVIESEKHEHCIALDCLSAILNGGFDWPATTPDELVSRVNLS
jgi:hypothetical protein